ncbi:MAG: AMP-binding protein [Caulobacter sp.]|nr:AMP-binding protein [Caulobacter sp.]
MDIRTLIDGQARRRGGHPFLIWEPFEGDSLVWSYVEFAELARRFAAGLAGRGVQAGDRVLVHLENCPEFILAWLGCAYAGVVPVTTNVNSTADELGYFVEHSRAVGAVTQPSLAALVDSVLPAEAWRVATTGGQGAGALPPAGFEAFSAIDGDPSQVVARPHDPWAAFGIQYTSGTTARPKAVLWTHANALWGAKLCAAHEDLRADDVHLTYLPLFHTNAQVYSVLASLWAGATVVLQPRFSASRFWPVSLRHGATWTSMVPFCARALAQQPVPAGHRYRFFGNAVCDAPWDPLFGVRSIGWWGMTETIAHGAVGSVHHPDAPLSIGRASLGYRLHVLDTDGRPVGPGQVGDLYVEGQRGVSLFLEYAEDPVATAAAFTPEGLFITGDRVRRGEDGWLYFADRSKDMLKVGGENVAASEVERVIAMTPGVSEVAVVGMPDPMLDETPAAFVIPTQAPTVALEQAIRDACVQGLAAFKRPTLIRFVDSLPRSTLEKVAKNELRDRLREELAASEGAARRG